MINNVRIPEITNIETAVTMFYEKIELSNTNIKELFGEMSGGTVARLKAKARDYMIQHEIQTMNAQRVNTKAAYAACGLYIGDLEMRYRKLIRLRKLSDKER